jgi:hypothetical protein
LSLFGIVANAARERSALPKSHAALIALLVDVPITVTAGMVDGFEEGVIRAPLIACSRFHNSQHYSFQSTNFLGGSCEAV